MRLFIILSILSFSLFGSYEKAQEFYKNKEFKKAIIEAKSSTNEYSNPKLHLIWAKSAEALGDMQGAMAAYERVVLLDKENIDARIALIGIYNKTGRGELSDERHDELKSLKLNESQKKLLALYKTDSSYKVTVQSSFALGYDTNVNASPGEDVLNDYLGVVVMDGEKKSVFSRLNANVSYSDQFSSNSNWYYRSDAKLFLQNNTDAHAYDFLYGSLGAGIGYKSSEYTFYIPVSYNRVYFLQTDLFAEYTISPKINYLVSKNFIMNFSAQYVKRAYIHKGDRGLDEKILRYGVGGFYILGEDYIYFNILRDDYKSDTSATAIEYVNRKAITLNLGVQYTIIPNYDFKVDYRYRNSKYDDYARISSVLLSTEQRSDDFHQLELKLTHPIDKDIEIYLSNQYSTNKSNYSLMQYRKNVTIFGVSAEF